MVFRQLPAPVRDRIADAAAVLVGLAGAVAVLVAMRAELSPADGLWWVDVLGGLGAAALLLWRRERPLAVAAANLAIQLVSVSSGLASAVALLNLAIRCPVRYAVGFTLASLVIPVVPAWLRGRPETLTSLFQTALLVSTVSIVIIACGLAIRARRELLASLVERAERAEAEQVLRAQNIRQAERNRIAREMHAGALAHRRTASAEETAAAAEVIRGSAREAMDDLRVLLGVLRNPNSVGEDEQDGAPQPRLTDVHPLLDNLRAAGMRIDSHIEVDDLAAVPELSARTLYRVAQEALTNAAKHAVGAPVTLRLSGNPGDGLHLEVTNPTSWRAADGLAGAGKGLVGITERVSLAGGELVHCGPDGANGRRRFRVAVRLPWTR